jgi:Animal haem peroxidase
VAHTQGGHRGQDIDNGYGRFGRLFPGERGPVFDRALMARLAKTMIKEDVGQTFNHGDEDENAPSGAHKGIPAAYTYFGQFVDHDLTLDLTGLGEQEADTAAVENFRSARLDLDCVYAHGLGSSRFLYDADKMTFQISDRDIAPTKVGTVQSRRDLFRAPTGTALIGDHRNDENVIVSQLHQAMTQFHNKVMTDPVLIHPSVKDGERLRTAARIVRHHYQWVVLKDYLKRICNPAVYASMVPPAMGVRPVLKYYTAIDAEWPFMPIEFSGAAYRFGHSMVRPSYALNAEIGTGPAKKPDRTRIPIFDVRAGAEDLRGFKKTRLKWGIDWGYLLDLPGTKPLVAFPGAADLPFLWQPAYRIDTLLVDPLAQLPDHMGRGDPNERSLAFLNLLRGSMLQLPTAEQVAANMSMPDSGGGAFPFMTHDQIWSFGSPFMDLTALDADGQAMLAERASIGTALGGNTPLWYYILREAEFMQTAGNDDEFGGRCLGPMGSILVLETFLALLWLDESSVMHTPGWRPMAAIKGAGDVNEFELRDLMRYALT